MNTADRRAAPEGPFLADPVRAARLGSLVARRGAAFATALVEAMTGTERDPRHPAAVLPAAAVARLVEAFDLQAIDEAMVLSIETARALARAPISGYRVGAVGMAGSGDLILGGNLELPGASIAHTVHGEGFVTLLARARGELVTTLAISQARPCAHCRQVLAEMAGAPALRLIDPAGHMLRLADLYPWPFEPGDLGMDGALPGSVSWPELAVPAAAVPADVARALVRSGGASHAPYGRTPAAVALRLTDGRLVTGSVLESVAFNPTIGPIADALVCLLASGADYPDIAGAWLAVPAVAQVGHEAPVRDALAAIAPGVRLQVTYWS